MFSSFEVFDGAPVSVITFLSVLVSLFCYLFLYRTPYGYSFRVIGQNSHASAVARLHVSTVQIQAMVFSGALAGLVGVAEVLGRTGSFKLDFSPGYGFIGIAVAFLGRCHPIAIIFSALLFGVLQKGASDLEIYTQNVTSDLSLVLQALIILIVSADKFWEKIGRKKGGVA
jgi:simple sugar transport system permease protein